MRKHRVVVDIVGGSVAAQLATDRRRAALEPPCDLADAESLATQAGDALTFDHRQVAVRSHRLSQSEWSDPTSFGAPAIASLSRDPDTSTGLDRADARREQLPVPRLDFELPLLAPTRHTHHLL